MYYRHMTRMMLLTSGFILTLLLMACGSVPTTVTPSPKPGVKPTITTSPTPIGVTNIPVLSGLTAVEADPAIKRELATNLPGKTATDLQLYTTDDYIDTAAATAHTALLKAGYTFSIPGQTVPTEQDDGNFVGLYMKSGLPDVVMVSTTVPADGDALAIYEAISNWPGISLEAASKFADQLGGKQALIILISAPNLVKDMLSGAN